MDPVDLSKATDSGLRNDNSNNLNDTDLNKNLQTNLGVHSNLFLNDAESDSAMKIALKYSNLEINHNSPARGKKIHESESIHFHSNNNTDEIFF